MIIGGSMETGSFLLAGTSGAEACFATTAHGSGRAMSRTEAKRRFPADGVREGLRRKGISVRAVSRSGLAEEAGGAYKDIEAVVDIVERAGISRRIVRLLPVGCVKG